MGDEILACRCSSVTVAVVADEACYVTRAAKFILDPSPAQERLLVSYAGSARKAYNWVIGSVRENLDTRTAEREADVAEEQLTPSMSWSAYALRKQFNEVKADVAPWWREVAKHCFDTGITQASTALKNWSDSRSGKRAGARVGFPGFKQRRKAKPSITFVELNHQLSRLHPSRHGVRLMLPQALRQSKDPHVRALARQLEWVHTVESTRRLYRLVEQGRASIQAVTFSYTGGRWQVAFTVRYQLAHRPVKRPRAHLGGTVGVDVGLTHLATLSRPIDGFSDLEGHVENPKPLAKALVKLAALDQRISRCRKDSKNRVVARQWDGTTWV